MEREENNGWRVREKCTSVNAKKPRNYSSKLSKITYEYSSNTVKMRLHATRGERAQFNEANDIIIVERGNQ